MRVARLALSDDRARHRCALERRIADRSLGQPMRRGKKVTCPENLFDCTRTALSPDLFDS